MPGFDRRFLAGFSLAAGLVLSACDAPDAITAREPLFSPDAALARAAAIPITLTVGDSASLVNHSVLARNTLREGNTPSWRAVAPAVATVNSAGTMKAVKAGGTRIIVTFKKQADTIAATVVTAQVASVSVSAAATSIETGKTTTVSAVARDQQGKVIPNVSFTFTTANAAVATVNASGTVSGVTAGTAKISAAAGNVSGNVTITVTQSQQQQPPPPPPAPPPGGAVALPNPPQLLSFTYPKVTGKTWFVAAGGNLQQAINSAQRGDEIVLAAGATFKGNFTLPAKSGTAANGWILIRSDRSASLPPQGTRVTPLHAPLMAKLETQSVYPALSTSGVASGWWISGLQLTINPTFTTHINNGLVLLGDGSSSQNTLARVASDLVLDRVYIHATPQTKTTRCIALNSARTAIQDSYVHECHLKGFDSQAIGGWNGPGPFKIVNNTLAGAGENIMFGGSDPSIPNLIPSDIEIRRNYLYTPPNWINVWTKKNLLEGKNMQRVLVESNIFDGSWLDGQVGYAVLLKSNNQSGKCTWCATRDVTFRGNIFRNIGAGFNLAGREGSNPHPVGELLTRVLIEQNIVENMMVGQFTGDSKFVQLLQNMKHLTVRQNTMHTTANFKMFLSLGSPPAASEVDIRNNIFAYGSYGLFSSQHASGEVSMRNVNGTAIFAGNVLVGPTKAGYPNSSFAASLSSALGTGAGANMSAVLSATLGVAIP